jgi:hypothetical protein
VDNTRQLELESDLVCLQVLQVQVHFAVVASVGHFSFSLKINVSFGYDSNRELCKKQKNFFFFTFVDQFTAFDLSAGFREGRNLQLNVGFFNISIEFEIEGNGLD